MAFLGFFMGCAYHKDGLYDLYFQALLLMRQ
jgi:hypothetical protein